MADWNELVEVTAQSGVLAVSSGVDFQKVLYLADDSDVNTTNFTERYRVYESYTSLLSDAGASADGKAFPSDSAIVLAAQTFWGQAKYGGPLVIGRKDAADADWGAAYNAVFAAYQDFWMVTAHTDVEYDHTTPSWAAVATAISDLASAVAASKRMYISLTGDVAAAAPASSDRHLPVFQNIWADETNYWLEPMDVAAAAVFSSANPDETSTTMAWQSVSGMTYADLSDTEKDTLKGNGYTMYLDIRGVGILALGDLADGSSFEERWIMDWFEVRGEQKIVYDLAAAARGNGKVDYTNTGIGVLGSDVLNLAKKGERLHHFEDDSSEISMPDCDKLDSVTKASHNLAFSASARFAGSVKKVTVTFLVSI